MRAGRDREGLSRPGPLEDAFPASGALRQERREAPTRRQRAVEREDRAVHALKRQVEPAGEPRREGRTLVITGKGGALEGGREGAGRPLRSAATGWAKVDGGELSWARSSRAATASLRSAAAQRR